jgi:hypothetical protein
VEVGEESHIGAISEKHGEMPRVTASPVDYCKSLWLQGVVFEFWALAGFLPCCSAMTSEIVPMPYRSHDVGV